MGFYINMEMPTSPVLFCIHPDGKVFADLEGNWREYKAVSVPPHGDLIDRDALMKRMWEETDCMTSVPATFVRDASTIIPADDPKEW